MNREHKIILSLYYADPNADPSIIREAAFSIGMDMLQLLLLMEGVFDKVEYKYYIEDKKIQGQPAASKSAEYQKLIEQSNNELQNAQIITVVNGGIWRFQELEYQDINSYSHNLPQAKKHLYFFNILIHNINGRSLLRRRETLICYRLFSIREGKEFISCLLSMMIKFVSAFLVGKKEEADEVINTLNKDYELLKTVYKDGKTFLENMQLRNEEMRCLASGKFFVNQYEIFETWVAEHCNIIENGDILEFIFYKNKALKNYTLHFMLHIVKISQVLMGDHSSEILWEKEFKLDNISKMNEFHHLDRLVDRLEKEGNNPSFDIIRWANEYQNKLYVFAKELSL